jgi:hypothetical protein
VPTPLLPPTLRPTLTAAAAALRSEAAAVLARPDLEDVLGRALLGPAAHEEYLEALAEIQPPLSPPARTPVPVESVVSDGLGGLSDEQLVGLAFDAAAFRTLGERVCNALGSGQAGEYWTELMFRAAETFQPDPALAGAARQAFDEFEEIRRQVRGKSATKPEPASAAGRGNLRRRKVRWIGFATSIAAALVVGVGLGLLVPSKPKQFEFAGLEARGDVTRGIEDVELVVTNNGNERAFVAVVGLFPGGRRPDIFSRAGTTFVGVAASETTVVRNLPLEFEGATVVLVVLTNVPAGEAIRVNLPASPSPLLSPDRAADLGEHLRRALEALNIRSQVRVIPLPSSKKN